MRIADAIMKYLELNGVEFIFGIAAGTTGAIVDAIIDTKIQEITVRHEGAASYCANAYAGMSNKLGVCMVGGIGAANALTGIYAAKRDKNPVLIITGGVQRQQMGKGAIQELDTEIMFSGCTRYSKIVQKEEDVLIELKKAIELAVTPPFAPVHICVPMDLQKLEFTGDLPAKVDTKFLEVDLSEYKNSIIKAVDIMNKEEKGIIMVGKGCRGFSKEIKELSKYVQWPIITTPQAKGVISTNFELNLGNYGF